MTETPETPTEPEIDTDTAEALLVLTAGQLLKGANETHDPRLKAIAAVIIETLKEGDLLETLLVMFAQQAQQVQPDPYSDPLADRIIKRMSQFQAQNK